MVKDGFLFVDRFEEPFWGIFPLEDGMGMVHFTRPAPQGGPIHGGPV